MANLKETVELSVIVPCLGHAAELRLCLDALLAQDTSLRYEIMVVDSGHDAAVANLVNGYDIVRLLRGDKGLDPGTARDLGVQHAAGRCLVFTDADCIPEAGFLSAARHALHRGARLATGPVLDADERVVPACDNLLQFVDLSSARPAGTAQLAPGCNLAISKREFVARGGFGAGLAEDVRFALRATMHTPGGLVFCPGMRVRHQGRRTWREFLRHHERFGFARGYYGLLVSPWQARLARSWLLVLPVALKRFSYIIRRTAKWNPANLVTVAMRSPLLLAGLTAWAIGFRRGLRTAASGQPQKALAHLG